MFTKEEHDLTYQAFNALLKAQGTDAVGLTLKVAAMMSKIQSMTEGMEQTAEVPPIGETAQRRGKKNGRGKGVVA